MGSIKGRDVGPYVTFVACQVSVVFFLAHSVDERQKSAARVILGGVA